MSDNLNKQILENYLLGKLADEDLLDQIEERLAEDSEFLEKLDIVEDDLIERYIFGELANESKSRFEKLFLTSKTRRNKLIFTKAIKRYALENPQVEKQNGFWAFFSFSPKLALALPLVLIAIFGMWYFVFDSKDTDNFIAQIDSLNSESRPVQGRIVDFEYRPYKSLRGEVDEKDRALKRKRRIIETKLLEEVEKSPNLKNLNNLGVFYLSGKNFDGAIEQFEEALKISEDDSQVRSNLGLAYFEKAAIVENLDEKLTFRARALEETTKAINKGDKKLELFFNRALILQALNLPRQSIDAWRLYLEKDSKSKWAVEAKKRLEELESQKKVSIKSKDKILEDFLQAFKKKDESTAWKIHSQTKELNTQKFIPIQLTGKYIESTLEEPEESANYLEALNYIGTLEKNKNADVFFYDLAKYYSSITDTNKVIQLQKTHIIAKEALNALEDSSYKEANQKLSESSKRFRETGNEFEARMLEVPIAFTLTRLGKLDESNQVLQNLEIYAREHKYKWLLTACLDWKTSNLSTVNEISKAIKYGKETLQISEETENIYEIQRISGGLSQVYYEFGETSNALKYISRSIAFDDLYNQSFLQTWRNYKHGSDLLSILGYNESAIAFGNEQLAVSIENETNPTHLQLSHIFLGQTYFANKDYLKALEQIDLSKKLSSKIEEGFQKNIHNGMISLLLGHILRKEGNCNDAIGQYDQAIKSYSTISEFTTEVYVASKGKLLCYQKDGKDELLEKELESILKTYELNRRQIFEDSYRNIYFDNEQTVYDIAISEALITDNIKKAFEFSEKSKSRSLLDFLKNGAEIKNDNITYNSVAQPLALAEIQKRMPPNVQLVEYSVLPKKVVTWIIMNNSLEKVESKMLAETLDKKIGDYLKILQKNDKNIEKIKARSNDLYEILIAPISDKLDEEKEIYFVGDKSLLRLPLSSLFSTQRNKYLIEEFTIASTPSATIFILTTEKASKQGKLETIISLGNPEFNRSENPKLNDLTSAGKEAIEVAKFYNKTETYIGKDATKENLLKNLVKADILHFAGHYVANEMSPLNSKLLLSVRSNNETNDLKVSEIARIKRNQLKLVILSACQTEVEQYYRGEGSIGAARIFLAIGTPVVVASHFEVDSESTAELMINFHKNRKEKGLAIIEALRQAQINMIQNKESELQSPFYWSAFSTIGGFSTY